MKINERKENKERTRQSRIVLSRKGDYIAKRVFKYQDTFGENSSGYERNYQSMSDAVREEGNWLQK